MISNAIDTARHILGNNFRIEQKLLTDLSFVDKNFSQFDGLYIIDYVMTSGQITDFTRPWFQLELQDRTINLDNFAKLYQISSFYVLVFEYPIIVYRQSFTIRKPTNFVFDTITRVAFAYNLIFQQ